MLYLKVDKEWTGTQHLKVGRKMLVVALWELQMLRGKVGRFVAEQMALEKSAVAYLMAADTVTVVKAVQA